MDKTLGLGTFGTNYKNECFLKWYREGRPKATEFRLYMPTDKNGRRPSIVSLRKWVVEWKLRAKELDLETEDQVVEEVVAAKIEMLRRHSSEAQEIQEMSLNYLREHKEELTPHAAVRLLQLGVDIERQSIGVPEALLKMQKLSNEDLLGEIKSIIASSKVDIDAIEDDLNFDEDE